MHSRYMQKQKINNKGSIKSESGLGFPAKLNKEKSSKQEGPHYFLQQALNFYNKHLRVLVERDD